MERQAKKTNLTTIAVSGNDPAKPVRAFADSTHYVIKDCFALAATDSVFAGVFTSAMAEIARQAGLTVA